MADTDGYQVELSIFSGRPNPSWKISSSHASLKNINDHAENTKSANLSYRHDRMEGKLGYRGFLLRHKDAKDPDLIVGPETKEFQKALLESMPEEMKIGDFHKRVQEMIEACTAPSVKEVPAPPGPTKMSKLRSPPGKTAGEKSLTTPTSAPVLNLAKWNDNEFVRQNNNCYNYANDQITNTFAQPGKASGFPLDPFSGKDVQEAAEHDGLKAMPPIPSADDLIPSTDNGRWIVALVVSELPMNDFHWFRLDSNGLWSHKPGHTFAKNTDNAGKLIRDPRKADISPYQFVSFMTTSKDVKIE